MSVVFPVADDPRWRSHTASVGQTVFPITYVFQDIADITIEKIALDGSKTTLVRSVDYFISGAGNPAGGSYTLFQPALAGEKYRSIGTSVGSRTTSIVRNGRYDSAATDSDLDRALIRDLELRRDVGRAFKLPLGSTADTLLPDPEADKFLAWDTLGKKLVNKAVVSLTGFLAGAAGLLLLAKDTISDVQSLLGISSLIDNLNVVNFSTGQLLNSTMLDHPIYVIATGQSNMLGHSVDGGDRSTKNNSVYVFEAIPSEPGQTVGWKRAGPSSPDWPLLPTGNSLAYQFCDRLQRATGRTVCLLIVAAGGQPVSEWLPAGGGYGGTGAMWGALAAAHTMALDTPVPGRTDGLTLRGMGRLRADYLLWHQGEADANYRPAPYNAGTDAEYKSRFLRFINAGIDPASVGSSAEPFIWADQTPILMGELFWGGTSGGLATDDRNTAIRELDRENPMIVRVSSRNLGSLDGLHFTGSALCTLADRYFERRGVAPKVVPQRVNSGVVSLGGGYVKIMGAVTVPVNTPSPGQTVTFPSINGVAIVMKDTEWVPKLTLISTGASALTLTTVPSKTVTGFNIVTGATGGNQVFHWEVIGQLAGT